MRSNYIDLAEDLEMAGLVWRPEIGDEVAERSRREAVSILVDPQGLTPPELRSIFIWLPTIEQIVLQVEARSGVLEHTGLEINEKEIFYKTVITSPLGPIESRAESLRSSVALALRSLLLSVDSRSVN